MTRAYLLLVVAVLFEGLGTTSLQASQQFTRLWPSLGVILGFGAAFFFLMQVLKVMPLGVTYALWSGLGICLTVFLGWLVFNQKVDLPAFLGLSMIVGGIVVINLFSSTATH
ncbi:MULTISPECIES: DMT family transporter [Roseovarius]|uniref:Multidrug resistance efflux protein, SMR family protein n=2 Tax=Roseovarius nubinhibens TaxID=314263 RepID=A3SPD7_ROSNI|nr:MULTISPECIES: SMR family transporter [Roseovarius]EAP76327.1 multidrug resistance efflux protein, SMR family protein [Roseovarius nubinhibens ISM]MAO27980.1 QacE family quaternary ammonium compound efflux SMR transporter [Roseovarius sp.]MAZ20360.1 QacE family quaternary ammonium compound efflux SMR transporter [Roseovarius sp.]MBU3001463.1 QacE family quaternary ammonium compound efflux SMR transporter [Roseovarius nubinhibens]HAR53210.1 QacE family quaternary ammonium compound efflux SMR |tara:strand:- start:1198 stop:1533 length:336 start_codon:yes stop_codon:yes gene_type:complete